MSALDKPPKQRNRRVATSNLAEPLPAEATTAPPLNPLLPAMLIGEDLITPKYGGFFVPQPSNGNKFSYCHIEGSKPPSTADISAVDQENMSTQAQKRWNSDIRNYENNTGRFASQTQSQNMNENTPKTSGNGADAFQEPGTTSNKRKNHFDVPGDQLEASSNSAFLVRQENSDKFTYVLVEGVAPPMLTGISAKDLAQMSRRAKKAWNKDLLHFANGTGRFTPVLIPEKVTVQKATADFHSHPYTNIPRQLSMNNNVSPPLRFFKRPRNGRHTFGLPAFLYKDPNNRGMLLYNAAVIDPPMHIDPDLYSKMTSEAQEEWAVRKEKALADLKTRLDSMTSAVRKL